MRAPDAKAARDMPRPGRGGRSVGAPLAALVLAVALAASVTGGDETKPRDSWLGQPMPPAPAGAVLHFRSAAPGVKVFCRNLPVREAFLGTTDRPFSRRFAPGRYRFSFVWPGVGRVVRDVEVPSEGALEIRIEPNPPASYAPKVPMTPPPLRIQRRPIPLKVRSIAGTPRGRTAVISYEGRLYFVQPGWTAPDHRYRIRTIGESRVELFDRATRALKVFHF